MDKPKVVCILGMHRSGTSIVTRILNILGISLGPEAHLLKPAPDNPGGFWEHDALRIVNDRLLSMFGGSWDEPPEFPLNWHRTPEVGDLRRQARAIIEADFRERSLWGWKDPRNSLTLPFWKELIPSFHSVICLRNPADVAGSLADRNSIPAKEASGLWLTYIASAIGHTSKAPRLFIFYEDLMRNWEPQVSRLAEFLGNSSLMRRKTVTRSIQDSIDQSLQHHRSTPLDSLEVQGIQFPTQALYMVLRTYLRGNQALGKEGDVNTEQLEEAIDLFSQYSVSALSLRGRNLAQYAASEKNQMALRVVVNRLEAQLANREEALADRGRTIEEHEELLEENSTTIRALKKEFSEKRNELDRVEQELLQKDDELQVALGEVERAGSEVRRYKEERSTVLSERDYQADQLQRRDKDLRDIKMSAAWRLSLLLRRARQLVASDGSRRHRFLLRFYSSSIAHVADLSDQSHSQIDLSETSLANRSIAASTELFKKGRVVASDVGSIGSSDDPQLQQLLRARLREFLSRSQDRLRFPLAKTPLISILIPVHNKAELTLQCLEAIVAHASLPYELIIVDDASTDETPELASRLENAVGIRSNRSLEFIRANNLGAKHIRGKYLLFLNNDVQPTPDWLTPLVQTMEDMPDCGAVGAKLVWPDGRLQEAGSIVWQDGSALGYGRGDDPLRPQFNYLREVDYCSAACLLVRTDLFKKLGHFDERYVPAFYEDTDLCFGIRSLGYKVYYQPRAVVFHHEYGSRSAEWAEKLCAQNQVKFRDKWSKTLSNQLPADPLRPQSILLARDRGLGKRVLVLDDRIPAPRIGSGFPRARALLESISDMGYKVTFMPLIDAERVSPDVEQLQDLGIEVFHDDWEKPETVLKERAGYFDIIIVSRPHNAKWLSPARKANPDSLIVYDAEAIFAMREIVRDRLMGKTVSSIEQARRVRKELAPVKEADIVITVSESEKSLVSKYHPEKQAQVWGHVHKTHPPSRGFQDRQDLLFVGGFAAGHPPNTDAVTHFAREVFPRVKEQLAGCKLYVVGSNPTQSVRDLAGESIIVTGYVKDLREFYEKCRVFVVPLRFGAGINYKLTEAMSHGIPSVVSGVAASGLDIRDDAEALIAEDDESFTEKVVNLYTDEALWSQVSRQSLEYISRECSPERMRKQLDQILTQNSKSSSPARP